MDWLPAGLRYTLEDAGRLTDGLLAVIPVNAAPEGLETVVPEFLTAEEELLRTTEPEPVLFWETFIPGLADTLPEFCLTAGDEERLTAEGEDVELDMLLLVTPDEDVLLADATVVPLFLLTVEVVTPIPSLLLTVPLFCLVVSVYVLFP